MKKVIIYSTPTCPYCIMAQNYLDEKGIKYEHHDVSANQAKAEEMVQKSGQQGVPVIDIDGKIIVGFDRAAVDKELGL